MKKLAISPEVSLTDDIVTKTVAILAQRRKGKTYTASVIAEEMVAAKVPFVVLDPTGAWWGLRSSADGKKPGLPVVILGGQHGDLPLERTAGKFIADLVLDHPGWYVIDFSLFESGGAERQFATDFAERLYRRKGQPGMDFALHLFVDEADRFVPQRVSGGRGDGRESDQRLLGAFESIVRRGGLRGLGTTLISQRAAVVNKNVLEQIDLLVMLRIMGPNDRKAIEGYLKADADDEQRKVLMGSLASLDIGEAWLWEPGGDPPLFDRVHIRARHTFNSSATPKPGQRRVEPSRFAEVDLEAVKDEMAAAIERAVADDPKVLRARIADLERQLKVVPKPEKIIERVETEVKVPSIPMNVRKIVANLVAAIEDTPYALPTIAEIHTKKEPTLKVVQPRPSSRSRSSEDVWRPSPLRNAIYDGDIKLGKAGGAVLTVLAQFPEGRTRRQLAMLAGYSSKGGAFSNTLSMLRTAGFINARGEPITITPEGIAALPSTLETLPSGPDLLTYWLAKLGKAEKAILSHCVDQWPKALTKGELGLLTGYEPNGGAFNNALSRLRTLELITGRGEIKADDTLAQEARS